MLIAEIGNNHFGDFNKAKEMIRIAKECGADLVKGQAFLAKDVTSGSMTSEFYQQCQFSLDQYVELIEYGARDCDIDVFFSIISVELMPLVYHQKWHKRMGSLARRDGVQPWMDVFGVIISVPKDIPFSRLSPVQHAEVLYVSDYMAHDPELYNINQLTRILGKQAGYSDHTVGVKHAIHAVRFHGAKVIEKHFCLQKDQMFGFKVFRDTQHGATPAELTELAKAMGK